MQKANNSQKYTHENLLITYRQDLSGLILLVDLPVVIPCVVL